MKEIGKTMFWMHNQFPKEHIIYYFLPNHVLISGFFFVATLAGCND